MFFSEKFIFEESVEDSNLKFGVDRFLGSLITNPMSDLQNSRWRTSKLKSSRMSMIVNQRFSGSLITNLMLDLQNSRWRIQDGGHQIHYF